MSQPQVRVYEGPAIAGPGQDVASTEIAQLRLKANDLKLRLSDLEVRTSQIADDRARANPTERAQLNKQWADATHELAATRIQLEHVDKQIHDLETTRDMGRVGITVAPPLGPHGIEIDMARERMIGLGSIILLLPLVLAWSRRLWHRGGPRPSVDLEASPRLQRIEQAVESIALEVERIGEAQRFTTRLLAERQPDAAARLGVPARREPGTITPH